MLPSLLLVMATILLAPWLPHDVTLDQTEEARLPVALVATASEPLSLSEGFDAGGASRRVMEETAERLRTRGVVVRRTGTDSFLVGSPTPRGTAPTLVASSGQDSLPVARPVTLSIGFHSAPTPWASGIETRFGGEGDAAWRLAARVQHHLVGGFRDVLGYRGYDRGALEQEESDPPSEERQGPSRGSPWVTAYPLFSSSPEELALLEWPETLDVISAALANAVYDYLSPSVPTPPREAGSGWRSLAPWHSVSPTVLRGVEGGTRVALTFDGGASSVPTPALLKALRDAGIRATMFMTADFVERNPGLVVQMARDGHEFGNHSSTHPDMTTISNEAIVAELDRLEKAVYAITGKSTRPWFRPPFGAYDDRVVRVAAEQGYYSVLWTADSADWREDVSAATVQRRLLAYTAPGAIMIEHLGSPQSAEVLPEVLRQLKTKGLEFGTLSEVVGAP